MFKVNKNLLEIIMKQFLVESYPDIYTSEESFGGDIDPEHIKNATEFVSNLEKDPDAETKFKDIAEQLEYDGDIEDDGFNTQFAAKGAKIKMLKGKTKKCSCGCDIVTRKESGGKLVSKCACGCKSETVKKALGGLVDKVDKKTKETPDRIKSAQKRIKYDPKKPQTKFNYEGIGSKKSNERNEHLDGMKKSAIDSLQTYNRANAHEDDDPRNAKQLLKDLRTGKSKMPKEEEGGKVEDRISKGKKKTKK